MRAHVLGARLPHSRDINIIAFLGARQMHTFVHFVHILYAWLNSIKPYVSLTGFGLAPRIGCGRSNGLWSDCKCDVCVC